MAEVSALQLTVGADVANLLTGMQKAGKSLEDFKGQLKRFQDALTKATDPAAILRLNKAIEASQAKIKAISSAGTGGFSGITKSSGQAGQALTDLGRVASDLPFGFLAIQNNLGPLVESFGRLKTESGGLKGALSAVGGSLLGPAGLFLGFQVVTAAITYFTSPMRDATSALSEAEKATKKYKDSLDNVDVSARASAQSEIAHVNVLAKIAADTTAAMSNRINAAKELQKTYPEMFGSLSQQAILEGKVADAINRTTQALLNKAAAQAAEKKFASASEVVYELQIAQKKAVEDLYAAEKRVNDQRKISSRVIGGNQFGTANQTLAEQSTRQFKQAAESLAEITKQLNAARKEQQGFLYDATKFGRAAGSLFVNNGQDVKLPSTKVPVIKAPKAAKVIAKVIPEVDYQDFRAVVDPEYWGRIGISPTIPVGFEVRGVDPRLIKEAFDPLAKQVNASVEEITRQMESDLIGGFAEGLGKVIAGGDLGQDLFGSIFSILGQGLSTLGKQLIAMSPLIAGIRTAFKTMNPALMLAAGVGLTAIGAIIRESVPKFAAGGLVGGSGNRDNQLSLLMPGEYVLNKRAVGRIGLNNIEALNSGANIGGGMAIGNLAMSHRIELKGKDLLIWLDRANDARGRLG